MDTWRLISTSIVARQSRDNEQRRIRALIKQIKDSLQDNRFYRATNVGSVVDSLITFNLNLIRGA